MKTTNLVVTQRALMPVYTRVKSRPSIRGKSMFLGDEKFFVRGVTYGAFRPNEDGEEFYNLSVIEDDFALMAENGITSVRIPHTTPPRALLDIAEKHNLRVMVGLSAEQYIGFIIDREGAPDILELIRTKVRTCKGHPALLCYAIGNEIPASIARWIGRRRVERYLERIYDLVKEEDPEGLVTYVNYPSTEYLKLPFLDLVCFNVYLEDEARLKAYLPRLQNIAGDRPLVMSEVGLDSIRNGEEQQAQVLDWQIQTAFSAGCAGVYIFSWTDEWYRGGLDVDDWAFGITDDNRNPKPALKAVREAFAKIPLPDNENWPLVSVIVCSHNGANRIQECCEGFLKLNYPNFEVIVVDDGSQDQTANIAREYGFRVIRVDHGGLSNARNAGLKAAKGEIVAYIDDDAYPDPDWLNFIVESFLHTDYAGVGGPNLSPADDDPIADCIGQSPGNPIHVLLTDEEAEHLPGCNMAFRKEALEAIGGFDPQFWIAGDDVDVCWLLRQRGYTLGFNHAAVVWHHRRNSIGAYWKQQVEYGKAEAILERKWPEKYDPIGHHKWRGRLYGGGSDWGFPFLNWRIYHGIWGTAPFQSLYEPGPGTFLSFSQTPEWWLVILTLVAFSALGILWRPLLFALIPLTFAIGTSFFQAVSKASQASFQKQNKSANPKQITLRVLIAFLHLLQPWARLWGRLRSGLAPWRIHQKPKFNLPRPQNLKFWSEEWHALEKRLETIETSLRQRKTVVLRGSDYDAWDLEVRGGLFGSTRVCMAVEDHGSGTQLIRFRIWPRFSFLAISFVFLMGILSAMSAADQAWVASITLGIFALMVIIKVFLDYAAAFTSLSHVLEQSGYSPEEQNLS